MSMMGPAALAGVAVTGVETNGALIIVLEEAEGGVIGRRHCARVSVSRDLIREQLEGGGRLTSSDTSPRRDKTRTDVDRVGEPRLHVDGGEGRVRPQRGLVVVRRLGPGAVAGGVAREEEAAAAAVRVRRRPELALQGEEELERARVVGAVGGDVEGEDGRDVVGGEDAVVLGAKGPVGLRRRDLRDVVRELELALGEGGRAPRGLVARPLVVPEHSLREEVAGGREPCGDQEGEDGDALHVGVGDSGSEI